MRRLALLGLSATLLAGGCEEDGIFDGGFGGDAPGAVDAAYRWTAEGWNLSTGRVSGRAVVEVTWELPDDWDGEAFRVYSRRTGDAGYDLVATVTSCSEGLCRYSDTNVAAGRSYDYYVTAVDQRSGRESEPSGRRTVTVPQYPSLSAPAGVAVTALDDALFVRWDGTGAERYLVFVQDGSDLFTVGETDGTGFLDSRARNGSAYTYRVVAVDSLGHASSLSATAQGTPRPDYHAELVYLHSDSAAVSGFRFRTSDEADPLVSGNDPAAQWRLESVNGALSLRPLGQTQLAAGTFTTALACGPGSEDDCRSVERAPSTGFSATPLPVDPGFTYVFRVVGDDGQPHHGKIRVTGPGTDPRGKRVLVFDWAYQLRANEASLARN